VDVNESSPALTMDVAELGRRAEEAKEKLQRVASTMTSKDGSATVTVNASGALQQLSFNPRAREVSHAQLAASVLATVKRAQLEAAKQVTAVMAPLIGGDSEAMHFLEEQIPEPEIPAEPVDPRAEAFRPQAPAPPAPPRGGHPGPGRPPAPPAPQPPQSRPVRPRPADDDDDDSGSGSILRRSW
jgi:DNA-binding protein YbaB